MGGDPARGSGRRRRLEPDPAARPGHARPAHRNLESGYSLWMPLTPPTENKGHAVIRALVESGVGMIPVVGPITRLFQTTHPSQFARDVELWQGDITATVNDLAERFAALEAAHDPKLILSDPAVDVAVWLLADEERSPDHPVGLDEIIAAFPDRDPALVEEAVHELGDADLVAITPVMGAGGARVRAEWPLIWLFEPLASGASPMKDAAQLAQRALSDDDLQAQAIQDDLGWSVRRINAALELIASFAPAGHVRRPSHPVFTVYGVHVDSGTRRRLRGFIGAGS